jgi:holo-[acyl-carrier protein] synthase
VAVVGVGVDVVDVERFAQLLTRRPALLERLFTAAERSDAGGAPERLAARFAAKEATLKALGQGLGAAAWHEMEVVKAPSGAPSLRLRGAAETLAASRAVTTWHLSLSHSASTAVAFVVGEH